MCIVDIVHNDLNLNNVMLHFPRDKEGVVFIGMYDWGMSMWINEDAPSNYGKESIEAMEKHKEKYNCAAQELFHVQGKRGTSQSLVKMARKYNTQFILESFSVGALAKRIYHHDKASNLF